MLKRKQVIEKFKKKDEYYYKNIIQVDSGLANLKLRLGQFEEALLIFKKLNNEMSNINKDIIDTRFIYNYYLQRANILNSIGDAYLRVSSESFKESYLDSADLNYKKSINILRKSSLINPDSEALFKLRKIDILIKKGDYKSALFYLNRYGSIFRRLPNRSSDYYYLKSITYRN